MISQRTVFSIGRFIPADVELEGDRIVGGSRQYPGRGRGAGRTGKYVPPGFVDIHMHGARPTSATAPPRTSAPSAVLGSVGVTTFMGTTMAFASRS